MPRSDSRIRQKENFIKWIQMTPSERLQYGLPVTLVDYAKFIDVSITTINAWSSILKVSGKLITCDKPVSPPVKKRDIIDYDFDAKDYLKARTKDVCDALMDAVAIKEKWAIELFFKVTDLLVEKSERKVTHELTADDFAKRQLVAQRQLEQFKDTIDAGREGYRVSEVQSGCALLPDKVREDSTSE